MDGCQIMAATVEEHPDQKEWVDTLLAYEPSAAPQVGMASTPFSHANMNEENKVEEAAKAFEAVTVAAGLQQNNRRMAPAAER